MVKEVKFMEPVVQDRTEQSTWTKTAKAQLEIMGGGGLYRVILYGPQFKDEPKCQREGFWSADLGAAVVDAVRFCDTNTIRITRWEINNKGA